MNYKYDTIILSRIASDLQKEIIRQTNKVIIADLENQVEALKSFRKELDDFRKIKELLKLS